MAAPVVQRQRPADGDAKAPPYQPVYLEIVDADADLVAASVVIKINDVVAWTGDAAQTGFSVTKTAITNGFSYSVLPDQLPTRGSTVKVDVYAEDAIPNSVSDVYYYTIGINEYLLRFDDFDDATFDPDLVIDNNNGTITEPAGTELKIDCPNSVVCDWWTSVATAPKAYFPFESWMLKEGVFQLESKLSGWDSTVIEANGGGPFIFVDDQNVFYSGYYEYPDDIRFIRAISNGWSDIYNSADNRVDPNTTPHLYRIIWNNTGSDFVLQDGSYLSPGDITFLYSEDLGNSWVRGVTVAMTLSHSNLTGFGVWLKKWNAGATANAQAYVDYLELKELLYDEILLPASDDGQVEVEVSPVDLGGPKEDGYYGRGLVLPGTLVGPRDDALVNVEVSGEVIDEYSPSRKYLPAAPTRDVQIDVEVSAVLTVATDFRRDTNDFNGHPHFISDRIMHSFFYDASAEAGPWTSPTDPSFTGYGKDGHYYVAGVDQGSFAPWYNETESDDRGPKQYFPNKVLICTGFDGSGPTPNEVVIFDLDNYPTTLNVWMRFRFGSSGGNYSMMGRVNQKPTGVSMANGILSVVCTEGDYRGHLILVNFTQPGKDCGHLIRSDNHLAWQPTGEIADRNLTGASQWTTTGVTVSLRTDEEQIHSVAMLADGADTWVAIAGEDPGPNLYKIGSYPSTRVQASGDTGDVNIGDKRKVRFDEDGNWWIAIENRLHRVLRYDYLEYYAYVYTNLPNSRPGGPRVWIELPYDINDFAAVGDYIFLATEVGVYRAHRGSMEYSLAYTVAGGGGGGSLDTPPAGELLPGEDPEVHNILGFALNSAHYLFVNVYRGVAVVRTLDDVVVDYREYPLLHQPYAHFNVGMIT